MNMISFLGFKGLLNKQLLFSERVALEKEFYEWCETALENGDDDEDYSLCMSCKYQTGNWVSDREVDTWCVIKSGIDCDGVFECDNYKSKW